MDKNGSKLEDGKGVRKVLKGSKLDGCKRIKMRSKGSKLVDCKGVRKVLKGSKLDICEWIKMRLNGSKKGVRKRLKEE